MRISGVCVKNCISATVSAAITGIVAVTVSLAIWMGCQRRLSGSGGRAWARRTFKEIFRRAWDCLTRGKCHVVMQKGGLFKFSAPCTASAKVRIFLPTEQCRQGVPFGANRSLCAACNAQLPIQTAHVSVSPARALAACQRAFGAQHAYAPFHSLVL